MVGVKVRVSRDKGRVRSRGSRGISRDNGRGRGRSRGSRDKGRDMSCNILSLDLRTPVLIVLSTYHTIVV